MVKNMNKWVDDLITTRNKKAFPLLSFPAIQIINTTVDKMVTDSDLQVKGMEVIAERCPTEAVVTIMDLSVEAEAFGSKTIFTPEEVPNIIEPIIRDEQDAKKINIPEVGQGRTGIYVNTINKVTKVIKDRPIFAGSIGPFSLAGRMIGITKIMLDCYEEPEFVELVLKKVTQFIIKYITALKSAGANGVIVAEPVSGLLSPTLMENMALPFMKEIIKKTQTDEFLVIYHNCGNAVSKMTDIIAGIGAGGYHFGNSVDMKEMLEKMPDNVLVMGNIDPAKVFYDGTPDIVAAETRKVISECCSHQNFIISSGCDIPPMTPWKNIEAFFKTVAEYTALKATR